MITEHHFAVQKTARYCLLGEATESVTDLWIVCHGFGQLARDFLPSFQPIAAPGRLIAAPEGLSRFYKSQGTVHTSETPVGATWMTTEDRENEIADYIGYLDSLVGHLAQQVSPQATVTALGFSQGAATVSRWVAASSPALRCLIIWAGLVPPEVPEKRSLGGLTNQPIQFVVGTEDRYFPPPVIENEIRRLTELRLDVHPLRFVGGHAIERTTLKGLIAQR